MRRLKPRLAEARLYDAIVAVPSDHMLNDCLCDEWEEWLGAARPDLVRRKRGALRQAGLSRKQRRGNAAKCFELVAEPPQAILLVDDVVTTGATVEAIAALLRGAGAEIVDVVALARARGSLPLPAISERVPLERFDL
jgi:predicted amidophosphoribosyltransferase